LVLDETTCFEEDGAHLFVLHDMKGHHHRGRLHRAKYAEHILHIAVLIHTPAHTHQDQQELPTTPIGMHLELLVLKENGAVVVHVAQLHGSHGV
jgi:D-lyxose ketol-isomerase